VWRRQLQGAQGYHAVSGHAARWQHELGMGYTLTGLCMRHAWVQITVASATLTSLNETVLSAMPRPSDILKWPFVASLRAALLQQLL
jgi:hypothetical protein